MAFPVNRSRKTWSDKGPQQPEIQKNLYLWILHHDSPCLISPFLPACCCTISIVSMHRPQIMEIERDFAESYEERGRGEVSKKVLDSADTMEPVTLRSACSWL
jgi:hypothetical protein